MVQPRLRTLTCAREAGKQRGKTQLHLQELHEAWNDTGSNHFLDGRRSLNAQKLSELCDSW